MYRFRLINLFCPKSTRLFSQKRIVAILSGVGAGDHGGRGAGRARTGAKGGEPADVPPPVEASPAVISWY